MTVICLVLLRQTMDDQAVHDLVQHLWLESEECWLDIYQREVDMLASVDFGM